MALALKSWLPQAERLAVGQRARVEHTCGPGSCMIVNHKHDGYSAYCFRCDDSGFKGKRPTLAEMTEARRERAAADVRVNAAVHPPGPATQDPRVWPKEARLWLYKAGFGNYEIEQLGFYFHEKSQRVVLPVVKDGQVIYWQARAVMPDHQPKYLNPDIDKASIIPKYGSADVIVLTEDILSAAKVGMVYEGWSMMGVKLSTLALSEIIQTGKPVIVWLDPDKAGRDGMVKTVRSLRSTGIPCARVDSDLDPKLHSRREIRTIIEPIARSLRRN